MTTRISGLASGMDIDSLVKKMVSAQQAKIDQDKQKVQILEWKQESYREVNLKLLALRNTISDLKLPSIFTGKKTKSSNESVIQSTATAEAANGTYIVKVNSLYTGVNRISTAELSAYQTTLAAQFGLTGTISFTLKGKDNVDKVYSFDTSTKSINDVVNAINANAAATGINAGYSPDGNRFVLATADKGADAKIEIVADDDSFLKNTLQLGMDVGVYAGTDASIDFEGASAIKFKSNNFTLNGINFSLLQTGTAAVTVSNDVDTAVEKIKKFIDAYNDVMENINTKLHESRAYDKNTHSYKYMPLTDEQKKNMSETQITQWETQAKKGIMRNESLLQSLAINLRTTFNDIMHNGEKVLVASGVAIGSKSTLNSYASTLASQFGITGTKSFTLKGKDGFSHTYSFDTTTQNMNDVVNAINADMSTSGIKATYSSSSNSFTLETVDKTQTANFEIVTDGDLFLKDTLRLGVSTGVKRPATNIVSGENALTLPYTSFSAIGIETGEYLSSSNDNGKLKIIESTLRSALEADASGVMKLFNATQTVLTTDSDGKLTQVTYNVGIALKAYDALTNNIGLINKKAGTGDYQYDSSFLSQDILRIEESISKQQERLADLEDRYYAQFTAMEKAIQKANAQSAWLSQQLGQGSNSNSR